MTTLNALGFFLLGLGMIFIPALFPGSFAPNALDGSNTSALWLGIMGLFQGGFGFFFILRNEAAPLALRLMTLQLPIFKPTVRANSGMFLRPLENGYAGSPAENQVIAA